MYLGSSRLAHSRLVEIDISIMLKSHWLAFVCATISILSATAADDVAPASEQVRTAITKALPTLEAGSIGSANKRQCFTCHSQAIPVFAFAEAKRQGFKIDDNNLARQLKHTHEHLKRGLENYRQGKGQGGDVLTAGYALWTLDEGDWPPDEVTEAVCNYLLGAQSELKHWRHRGNRPPTSGSDFTATYVGLRSLQHFGTDSSKSDAIAARRESVTKWLETQPAVETEDLVFRLNALLYSDARSAPMDESLNSLLGKQRGDGGWGQMDNMETDAYSTGSAIMAIVNYRDVSGVSDLTTTQAIQKGVSHLLATQLDDGTWHVSTRAKPVQEYFESDFPHGKDQFISIAATAWSTLALLHALKPNEQGKSLLDNDKIPAVTLPATPPSFSDVDRLCEDFVRTHEVPGASVAITEATKLVYARGFGFAEVETKTPATPTSLFRIASISKPITAVAVLQLAERGKLILEANVFELLELSSEMKAAGAEFDARLRDITIEQLLQHRGGWDRDKSFDPMFQSVRFANLQNVQPPASQREIILSMLSQKLDFEPGERYAYSNFGYCLLGRVIEKIAGIPYESYVQQFVLKPLGITTMRIGATRLEGRVEGEVRYYASGKSKSVFQSDLGDQVPPPYGAWNLEAMDSHGGWLASAEDLAKFSAAFDDWDNCPVLSRSSIERMHARPPGLAGFDENGNPSDTFYSLGWFNRVTQDGSLNYWHTGSLPGTMTILIRRRDGRNMVALLNTRDSPTKEKLNVAIERLVHKAADKVKQIQVHTDTPAELGFGSTRTFVPPSNQLLSPN
jgi:CubicO group peptidase (beta-lactamase class C family)